LEKEESGRGGFYLLQFLGPTHLLISGHFSEEHEKEDREHSAVTFVFWEEIAKGP
jgi:hypothetical protein